MNLKKTASFSTIIALAALLMSAMASCENPANSPKPDETSKSKVVNIAAIQGVIAPVVGAAPVTKITENDQYTGTVAWSPDVDGTFALYQIYTATITLTPKSGYTLNGVAENFFTVAGASSVRNSANSGVVTAEFPYVEEAVVSIADIQGVTAPATGATPVWGGIIENEQYTGRVMWTEWLYYGEDEGYGPAYLYSPFSNPFGAFTQYAAVITLTPKPGYTFRGVPDDFFTVEGAELAGSPDHDYSDIRIIAVFPATGGHPPTYGISLYYYILPYYKYSPAEDHTFPAVDFGYTAQSSLEIIVTNTGNQPTGEMNVSLTGAGSGGFTLSTTSLSDMEEMYRERRFYVSPSDGLGAGTYAATLTVSGDNGVTAGFNVSFTVNAPTYGISLSTYEVPSISAAYIHTFPAKDFGYGFIYPLLVTVKNTGNQPTGSLSVALTGNSDSFSTFNTPIIAVGKTGELDISPKSGLAPGTYAATVTLSGSNGITASFNVSFTVNPPTYGVSLSPAGTYTFPAADFNYGAQTPLTVTITNTGNQPTGRLVAQLSGANQSSFALSVQQYYQYIDNGAAPGGTATFTVVPKTGLAPGIYTETVKVSKYMESNGISFEDSFNVSFTVNAPTYGVSLSSGGAHTFPAVIEGYGTQTPITVTVTNTSNQPTGGLTLALTGTDAGSFTLSTTSISNIAVGGNSAFAVVPKTGLSAGTYAATVTVSGSNGITAGFNVSLTVNPATYGVSLSGTDTYTFPAVIEGYGTQAQLSTTVTNTGNQPTGNLIVTLTGTNPAGFTLLTTSMNSIAVGGNSVFNVSPKTGLVAGTHTATVTVSGSNGITASFNLSFTVISATHGISISANGDHTFLAVDSGYTAQTPLAVTVTNTGNQPTGNLTVTLTGANPGGFTLSPSSISGIAVGGSSSFTVVPKTGLAPGTYAATVTVSGSNGITAGFNVSFFVEDPTIPYIITGSGSFTATRGGVTIGTANQPIQTVINNIRAHAAGRNRVIQFGNNGEVLYSEYSVSFNNTGGSWGMVTLTGKISTLDTMEIDNSVSVTSSADIANIKYGGWAVYNKGVLNITGGTVSAIGTISGNGTSILPVFGIAVYNYGTLNISGGTVMATQENGYAVVNHQSGRITVSGTAKVTSMNKDNAYRYGGTIYLSDNYTTAVQLEITGGTVENTAAGGYTIHNYSTGAIRISGGTITATGNGIAVLNKTGSSVIISGGTISAPSGEAVRNGIKNAVTITKPPAVIIGSITL